MVSLSICRITTQILGRKSFQKFKEQRARNLIAGHIPDSITPIAICDGLDLKNQ